MKTQVGDGLDKLFGFRGQSNDVSDKSFFVLTYMVLCDK